MELRQIEFFLQLYKDRNITVASQNLYISQQGMSKSIANFEKEVGFPLFKRSVSGVKPTAEAGELYSYFRTVMKSYAGLQKKVNDIEMRKNGVLSIVWPEFFALSCEKEEYATFSGQNPGIEISVMEESEEMGIHLLREGLADVAFMYAPIPKDLESHVIIEREPLCAVIKRENPLAEKENIDQSVLYMRIYFLGMPFFMLYNYGAAILRAVGDTKRPLFFLVISGMTHAVLNLVLVIVFHLGVAGVAIGTIVSQLISSILVLRCLYTSNTSYRLYFSKLGIKTQYLKQIFQVGIPAGIQSTVINLSNALLQSSVNSFGSVAMAGYTAANNIFGFLYMSVNAVTQSCMSFTSQNYGVKKLKRMDRVLLDCMILSVGVTLTLGCGAYFFGPELLKI